MVDNKKKKKKPEENRQVTVEEVQQRRAEATPAELEAQAARERIQPEGFTQSDLDALRRRGIDVIGNAKVRIALSEYSQRIQERGEEFEKTFLQRLQQEEARPEAELIERAPIALERAEMAPEIAEKTAKFIFPITNPILNNERVNRRFKTLVEGGLRAVNKFPLIGNRFNDIIRSEEEIIQTERESMNAVVSAVNSDTLSVESGLQLLDDIETRLLTAHSIAHRASKYSATAWTQGMDDVETRLNRARREVEIRRRELLRVEAEKSAQFAAVPTPDVLQAVR